MKTQDFDKSEADAAAAAASFDMIPNALPVVINSLPKSGTVLLRNILMGFYGVKSTRLRTITWEDMKVYTPFSEICEPEHRLLVGHLSFNPVSNYFIRSLPFPARMILLIRNPVDQSYSLARNFFRPGQNLFSRISEDIIDKGWTFDEMVTYCITGIQHRREDIVDVLTRYKDALAWKENSVPTIVLKYEDLIDSISAIQAGATKSEFFQRLFEFCGIVCPHDWTTRIKEMAQPSRIWTHVTYDSEEERSPNRPAFVSLINGLFPKLMDFAGYSGCEESTSESQIAHRPKLESPTTLSRLLDVVATTFAIDPTSLGADTTAEDVDGWDSVTHSILILELEREFGTRLEFGETIQTRNLGELAALIEQKAMLPSLEGSAAAPVASVDSKPVSPAKSADVVGLFLRVPVEDRASVLRDLGHAAAPAGYRGFFINRSKPEAEQKPEILFELDGLVNAQSLGFAVEMIPLMYPFLRKLEGRGTYLEVLDVGSRTGAGAALFSEIFMSYHSHLPMYVDTIDIDPTFHDYKRSRWPRLRRNLVGDIFDLPPKAYDFIVCSHTVEHVADPIPFCQQLQRIAKEWVFVYCPYNERNPISGHHTVGDAVIDQLGPVAKQVMSSWWWRPKGVPVECVFFVLPAS